MPKKTDLQIKMDLLKKLFDTGCVTEKQLQGLEMEDILLIPGITVDEMKELVVLQKCSKKNRLFSFLSGNSDQKEEENSAESYL